MDEKVFTLTWSWSSSPGFKCVCTVHAKDLAEALETTARLFDQHREKRCVSFVEGCTLTKDFGGNRQALPAKTARSDRSTLAGRASILDKVETAAAAASD